MKMIVTIGCLLLLSPACKRSICCGLPAAEMVHTQTQCADAWGYGASNDETIAKLTNYLLQKNIITSKTTLQSTGETMVCNACTCSRGFVFHVWVQSQYINGLTAEGFTVK